MVFCPGAATGSQGALHYLYFLALGAPLALALQAVHVSRIAPFWGVVATFARLSVGGGAVGGVFVSRRAATVAGAWTYSRVLALALASVVFGTVHLWFRGFPNWRWALIATLLGLVCGHARNHTGGIRAGVVTHALVVATWRAFFS